MTTEIPDAVRHLYVLDMLTKPGVIKIANASYSSSEPSLGTLEDMGAGRIIREYSRYVNSFGFHFHQELKDGTPIRATIDIGSRLMNPGDYYLEDY